MGARGRRVRWISRLESGGDCGGGSADAALAAVLALDAAGGPPLGDLLAVLALGPLAGLRRQALVLVGGRLAGGGGGCRILRGPTTCLLYTSDAADDVYQV